MSTIATPAPFDAKKFMEERNAAQSMREERKPIPEQPKTEEPAEVAEKATEHEPQPRPSRSWNRLQRQLGEERARREMAEEQLRAMRPVEQPAPDPEPQRKDFQDDATYWRAVGKWDARQEIGKTLSKEKEAAGQTEAQKELGRLAESAREKFQEDVKLLPDFDKVAAEAAEDEDAPEFTPADHPHLMALLATSDVQAAVMYWLAKNPDDMQALLDLTGKPAEQIQKFRRLEGRAERLYNTAQKPAQGPEETQKDRKHPAEEAKTSGRNGKSAAELDARKPRPSTEVAAKGGSAAPEEPAIGSRAWMERRNQRQYGSRY